MSIILEKNLSKEQLEEYQNLLEVLENNSHSRKFDNGISEYLYELEFFWEFSQSSICQNYSINYVVLEDSLINLLSNYYGEKYDKYQYFYLPDSGFVYSENMTKERLEDKLKAFYKYQDELIKEFPELLEI